MEMDITNGFEICTTRTWSQPAIVPHPITKDFEKKRRQARKEKLSHLQLGAMNGGQHTVRRTPAAMSSSRSLREIWAYVDDFNANKDFLEFYARTIPSLHALKVPWCFGALVLSCNIPTVYDIMPVCKSDRTETNHIWHKNGQD